MNYRVEKFKHLTYRITSDEIKKAHGLARMKRENAELLSTVQDLWRGEIEAIRDGDMMPLGREEVMKHFEESLEWTLPVDMLTGDIAFLSGESASYIIQMAADSKVPVEKVFEQLYANSVDSLQDL
jgi:hypothetical protein